MMRVVLRKNPRHTGGMVFMWGDDETMMMMMFITIFAMKPSGTSLHKMAAPFVKHKRAGAPDCRPQMGRTELMKLEHQLLGSTPELGNGWTVGA